MRQLKITKSITNRESASLDKYLQEIGREDLITVEEEVELAQAIKRGDRQALEKLTRANLRFVARQRSGRGHALHGMQDGAAGLGDGARHQREHRRLPGQLRRTREGAVGTACPVPEPAGQRLIRDCGRDGHQHPHP